MIIDTVQDLKKRLSAYMVDGYGHLNIKIRTVLGGDYFFQGFGFGEMGQIVIIGDRPRHIVTLRQFRRMLMDFVEDSEDNPQIQAAVQGEEQEIVSLFFDGNETVFIQTS